jgi:hypothetical protein
MGAVTGVSALLMLFLIVLAILWLLVPFLIMGTNRRLDKVIEQNAQLLRSHPSSVMSQSP